MEERTMGRVDPEDELICLGHGEDPIAQGGALAPPIAQTAIFAQPSLSELMAALASEHDHRIYSRGNNPTVEAVEAKLARLERGEACRCLASGMAAISAVLTSVLEAGDHVLLVNQVYGPTRQLMRRLERFGVRHDVTLDLDPAAIAAALTSETRLIWLESPGTMLFRALDVAAVAALARERDITTVLDNSWATPLFQKPLTQGVDLVVHSATKYLGGHSDLVAGAVVGSAARLEKLFHEALLLDGGVLAPFDAWLLNRGLRTLPVRMRRHHESGLAVARFLAAHPRVRRVFHPIFDPARRAPGQPARNGGRPQRLLGAAELRARDLALRGAGAVRRRSGAVSHRRELGRRREPGSHSRTAATMRQRWRHRAFRPVWCGSPSGWRRRKS